MIYRIYNLRELHLMNIFQQLNGFLPNLVECSELASMIARPYFPVQMQYTHPPYNPESPISPSDTFNQSILDIAKFQHHTTRIDRWEKKLCILCEKKDHCDFGGSSIVFRSAFCACAVILSASGIM